MGLFLYFILKKLKSLKSMPGHHASENVYYLIPGWDCLSIDYCIQFGSDRQKNKKTRKSKKRNINRKSQIFFIVHQNNFQPPNSNMAAFVILRHHVNILVTILINPTIFLMIFSFSSSLNYLCILDTTLKSTNGKKLSIFFSRKFISL